MNVLLIAAARRRVNRAVGQLRDAGRELASLENGDVDLLGVLTVNDDGTAEQAERLVRLGVNRYGAVDVVVAARPGGHRSTPTTAAPAAEEMISNGSSE